jgi:uridine kinase
MTIEDIIIKTKKLLEQKPEHPIMIMVAGGSATGKSTQILPRLLRAFSERALLVEQDWYQLGVNFAERDETPYKWDDPRNFQIERFTKDLTQLRNGQPIIAPSFDVVEVGSVGERRVEPKPVIIVDGIYTLYDSLGQLADFSVYVTMPLYARFLRRLFRMLYDQKQDKPQTAFKQVFGPVLQAHQDIVSKQAELADCVITIPYSFTDTIERYTLTPSKESAPPSAVLHFEHEGLRFWGEDEGENYHVYITYEDNLYYDFLVDEIHKSLLNNLDYLSM